MPHLLPRHWALAFLLLLGACQRATYSFQTAHPSLLAGPPPLAATTPLSSMPPAAEFLPSQAARHRLRSRRLLYPRATMPAKATATRARAPQKLLRVLATGRAASRAATQQPLPTDEPVRYRSCGIALLAALLPLLFGIPLGLHYFYLGYVGRSLLNLAVLAAAFSLIVVGFGAVFFAASNSATALFGIGSVLYSALFILQIIDVVRIAIGNLKPKNGEYNRRFFQVRSATEPAMPSR
ncbi:MAG: hypothetical protein ACRYFK_18975 [Janthinobacterium lividum]